MFEQVNQMQGSGWALALFFSVVPREIRLVQQSNGWESKVFEDFAIKVYHQILS